MYASKAYTFCDFTGTACIRFLNERHQITVPIRHGRTRSWLAGLCWRAKGVLLAGCDIDRVLNILEDIAWGADHRDAADRNVIEVAVTTEISDDDLKALLVQMKGTAS